MIAILIRKPIEHEGSIPSAPLMLRALLSAQMLSSREPFAHGSAASSSGPFRDMIKPLSLTAHDHHSSQGQLDSTATRGHPIPHLFRERGKQLRTSSKPSKGGVPEVASENSTEKQTRKQTAKSEAHQSIWEFPIEFHETLISS